MMIIDQEKLVDNIIINDIVKVYPELKTLIDTCSPYEVRGKILSVLDPRNDLHYDYREFNELNLESEDLEYLDEIVTTLRNYVRVADVEREDFGEVMTPIDMAEEMFDTLPKEVWSNPDLKWLDPCNGVGTFPSVMVQRLMKGLKKVIPNKNKRYRHIVENMLYVCELQAKNMFIFHCIFDRPNIFELNTFYGSFLSKEFDEHMKNVWGIEKFDIIIGNPPYNKNIDLDFLKKSHDISDIVLFVHPSVWVMDNKFVNKPYNQIREHIKDRLKSLTLFNGNHLFNISIFSPCTFTYITKEKSNDIEVRNKITKKTYKTKNIYDIDLNDCDPIYLKLKEKIKILMNENSNLWDKCLRKQPNTKNFEVGFSPITGNKSYCDDSMFKNDFHTLIRKKDESKHIGKTTDYKLKYGFDTLDEATNFFNYIKTSFVRFCLSIYKQNQHTDTGELKIVPYLDFTQEWTDEKLYQHFNLTQEEIDFINKHIPKYY